MAPSLSTKNQFDILNGQEVEIAKLLSGLVIDAKVSSQPSTSKRNPAISTNNNQSVKPQSASVTPKKDSDVQSGSRKGKGHKNRAVNQNNKKESSKCNKQHEGAAGGSGQSSLENCGSPVKRRMDAPEQNNADNVVEPVERGNHGGLPRSAMIKLFLLITFLACVFMMFGPSALKNLQETPFF